MLIWFVTAIATVSLMSEYQPGDTARILLADTSAVPTVTVRWIGSDGEPRSFSGTRAYTSDSGREYLGGNLEAYVAMGGVRLTKGAGHPRGAIARVGFYKREPGKPLFEAAARDTEFVVVLSGLRFNQPVDPNPLSGVQHLKYARDDLIECGLPGDAREQFNTASSDDTLNGRVRPGTDARLGILDGSADALGAIEVVEMDDGSITAVARFLYPALRNLRDPWQSDLPGTFLEPVHFHIEFEVLPKGIVALPPVPPAANER
ncbi:MAG: hypothetical protein AAGB51_04670 [Planctomycetota bacterium]